MQIEVFLICFFLMGSYRSHCCFFSCFSETSGPDPAKINERHSRANAVNLPTTLALQFSPCILNDFVFNSVNLLYKSLPCLCICVQFIKVNILLYLRKTCLE